MTDGEHGAKCISCKCVRGSKKCVDIQSNKERKKNKTPQLPKRCKVMEAIKFDCKESLFILVFKYRPLSAQSSKKHGHTITHNSHQSLSVLRWIFLLHVSIERMGRWGKGVSWFHVKVKWSRVLLYTTLSFFFFSLWTFLVFSDNDTCT